jgi:iron complex transport system permease protein
MKKGLSTNSKLGIFLLLLPLLFCLHFFSGEIDLSLSDLMAGIFHFDVNETSHLIVREFRIPRFIMACIAGAALSVSGLLMQTLFNNPLAGPYVLGFNSGSSLFVALTIMTGLPFFRSDLGLIGAALLGALLFGLLILSASRYVRNSISLLLIGLMLASFSGAIVSILQYMSEAQALKIFTLWSLGSLQQVELAQLPIISIVFGLGVVLCFLVIKPLNAFALGESDAKSLGISVKSTRTILIVTTAVLTGLTTAFCGPIAFIGLAVPNLVKVVLNTQNHKHLIIACLFAGAGFMVLCDIAVQLLVGVFPLPINAVTSLVGAPIVIAFILKKMAI